MPQRNAPDLDDVPADVLEALTVHLVSDVREVLDRALEDGAGGGSPPPDAGRLGLVGSAGELGEQQRLVAAVGVVGAEPGEPLAEHRGEQRRRCR